MILVNQTVLLLSNKDGFGIKYPTKFNIKPIFNTLYIIIKHRRHILKV